MNDATHDGCTVGRIALVKDGLVVSRADVPQDADRMELLGNVLAGVFWAVEYEDDGTHLEARCTECGSVLAKADVLDGAPLDAFVGEVLAILARGGPAEVWGVEARRGRASALGAAVAWAKRDGDPIRGTRDEMEALADKWNGGLTGLSAVSYRARRVR